ncbi:M28 family peptidase [Granulicella arctica]|uniref:M28 family peptidase n=1 Tax=Granulicella arctica TaxID=940613 RepID=UPI0021E00E9C|nr:M28 family peptidase [Granulicella arctica]
MTLKRPFATALLLSLPLVAQTPAQTDWDAAGAKWWAHVQYLASDDLKGRLPGTPGFELATQYVVAQFKAIGLKPAGGDGYLQPIKFLSEKIDTAKSSVEIEAAGKKMKLAIGEEINLSAHVSGTAAVDAPLVFIGYGLRLPNKRMDDYPGLDLRGKVVVLYNGAPARLQGPLRAYSRMPGQRWKALKAAGVIGMIAINPPRPLPGPAPVPGATPAAAPATPRPAARPTILFADSSMDTLEGMRLNATMLPKDADKLLSVSGHTMAELQPLIDAGKPLPTFAMNATIHAMTATEQNPAIDTHNVVGELEGSDSKLKHEYIVISAHLDHLGVGRPVKGDAIYNGAMDNASGVASVIETAKLIAAGPRPKRSILFIALTGEEMGELGSAYFATKPTVDKAHVVADLNMDMFLPLFPLRYLEVQGLGESTLGNDARAVGQLNDVEVQFEKQPEENRFIRSDQVNFVAQGIPALAFKFGWTPDSPEMKTFNDWVKTRYHQPSDDLEQPIDKAAAAQFDSYLAQLAVRVANTAQRPAWYPESSFATK